MRRTSAGDAHPRRGDTDVIDLRDHPEPSPERSPRSSVAASADAASTPPDAVGRAFVPGDRVLWITVLVAAALRFWRIGAPALWYDEYISSEIVKVRFLDLFDVIGRSEGTPPLYYLTEWAWIRVFGRGDAALRSSSALFGTLTVVAVYALMVELRQTRRAAQVAAVLIALNPLLIWYSREARAYALFAFLTAVGLVLFARAVRRGRRADLLLWSLGAALTFATHYFAAFLIVPQGLWLLSTLWRQKRWRDALLTFVPLGLLGLGLVAMALDQKSEQQDWIGDAPMTLRLAETGRSFLLGPSIPSDVLLIVALVPLAYAAYAVVRFADDRQRQVALQATALAAVGFLVSLVAAWSFFVGRNSIATVVLLTVPVAIGLTVATPPPLGRVAAIALCGVWLAVTLWVAVDPDLQKANWKHLADTLDQEVGQDNTVVLVDNFLPAPLPRYGLAGTRIVGPDETILVEEINIVFHVSSAERCGRWAGLTCDAFLWPSLPRELAGEFTFDGRQHIDHFKVVRYRAAAPVRLRPDDLVYDAEKTRIFLLDE